MIVIIGWLMLSVAVLGGGLIWALRKNRQLHPACPPDECRVSGLHLVGVVTGWHAGCKGVADVEIGSTRDGRPILELGHVPETAGLMWRADEGLLTMLGAERDGLVLACSIGGERLSCFVPPPDWAVS